MITLNEVKSGLNPISTTYTDLVNLITSNGLTPGASYLISNFQTIYDQPDFDNTGAQKTSVATLTGPTEPLIVTAVTVNSLDVQAYSTLYPKDYITYDISYNSTEVMSAPAKGRITERITYDTKNRADYDVRNVVFKRYESSPGSGIYSVVKDNGGASISNISTFNATNCNNNYLGNYTPEAPYTFLLSNNIFGADSYLNIIEGQCFNNSFIYRFYKNNVGSNCNFNIINVVANASDNYIGNDFMLNNINVLGFTNNNIGSRFEENNITCAGRFDFNVIDDLFTLNNFNLVTNSVTGNKIGFLFSENIINGEFRRNEIGNNVRFVTVNNTFSDNKIGNQFENNILTVFTGNIVGNNCKNNVIISAGSNNIGNSFIANGIGYGFNNNKIGNNFNNNPIIGNIFADNDIGNTFENNASIGDNFTYNKIGNDFKQNVSIGNDFKNNDIGDYFGYNTIGNNFSSNEIKGFFGIDINYNPVPNTIGDYFNDNTIDILFLNNNIQCAFFSNNVGVCFGDVAPAGNSMDANCTFFLNSIGAYFGYLEPNIFTNYSEFEQNVIGNSFYGNTFNKGIMISNKVGNYFIKNEIPEIGYNNGYQLYWNEIGDYFGYNKFKNTFGGGFGFENNKVGNFCGCYGEYTPYPNSFNANTTNNVIGNLFQSNITSWFSTNRIGDEAFNNNFGGVFSGNTIGTRFRDNFLGDVAGIFQNNFNRNTIGDCFQSNNVKGYFEDNLIGFSFCGNTIGALFRSNVIGDYFGRDWRIPSSPVDNPNTIGNNFTSNNIGNLFLGNAIGVVFGFNKIGNYFYNNTIGDNFGAIGLPAYFDNSPSGNVIGDNFAFNTIGNDFQNNEIDNFFGTDTLLANLGNTVANSFQYNKIMCSVISTNFTPATHVYQTYNCTISKASTGTNYLQYINGTPAIVIVSPTS